MRQIGPLNPRDGRRESGAAERAGGAGAGGFTRGAPPRAEANQRAERPILIRQPATATQAAAASNTAT